MRRLLVLILLLLTFSLGLAFSYHNPQAVTLNYLAGSLDAPLGVLLIATMALSIALMIAIYWVLSLPRRAEVRRLKRRIDKAESELDGLRSLPLKDG